MEIKHLKKALENGISLETYCVLKIIEDGALYEFGIDVSHYQVLGLVDDDRNLTEKAVNLLKFIEKEEKSSYIAIHEALQNKLLQLTGRKQKVLQGKYSFLCNAKDLENRIIKVAKKYKLLNINKIEKCLVRYIEECHKKNFEYCQLIIYYIEKDGNSNLATDYLEFEETQEQEFKSTQKFL